MGINCHKKPMHLRKDFSENQSCGQEEKRIFNIWVCKQNSNCEIQKEKELQEKIKQDFSETTKVAIKEGDGLIEHLNRKLQEEKCQ